MPSGEAFIRQQVYGQRYFIKNFGYKCETAWLPDTFGLSGSLPQILRSAGKQAQEIIFAEVLTTDL
jgi:alpha-mannosidase